MLQFANFATLSIKICNQISSQLLKMLRKIVLIVN